MDSEVGDLGNVGNTFSIQKVEQNQGYRSEWNRMLKGKSRVNETVSGTRINKSGDRRVHRSRQRQRVSESQNQKEQMH